MIEAQLISNDQLVFTLHCAFVFVGLSYLSGSPDPELAFLDIIEALKVNMLISVFDMQADNSSGGMLLHFPTSHVRH